MARIRPLGEDEVSPEIAGIIAATVRWLGEPQISVGIQAYPPPVLDASRRLNVMPARDNKRTPDLPPNPRPQAQSWRCNGSSRTRLPARSNNAFPIAGAMGTIPGSPAPVDGFSAAPQIAT